MALTPNCVRLTEASSMATGKLAWTEEVNSFARAGRFVVSMATTLKPSFW